MNSPQDVVLCWSGGKDSCLALHQLRLEPRWRVVALMTMITEGYDRISMHGVRRELLEQQAAALGLPLHVVTIPQKCPNTEYESRMAATVAGFQQDGVNNFAFGDLFLTEVRRYREERLASISATPLFPIWGRDTSKLLREFIALGYKAVISCVDTKQLDASFAGAALDESFLKRYPAHLDPCGENGEFHSFVFNGPGFSAAVPMECGEVVLRDQRFAYCDLRPRCG